MHKEASFTLTLSRSKSTKDNYLNKLGRLNTPNATYHTKSQGHWSSGSGEDL